MWYLMLQDEFLRAMKASVRAALSTASAALDQPETLGDCLSLWPIACCAKPDHVHHAAEGAGPCVECVLRCTRGSWQMSCYVTRVTIDLAGSREAADKALAALQQQFFPELVRNTQLFTELFERNARPALIRVRTQSCMCRLRIAARRAVPRVPACHCCHKKCDARHDSKHRYLASIAGVPRGAERLSEHREEGAGFSRINILAGSR